MQYSVTAEGFLSSLPMSPPHKDKDNASTASSSTESFSTPKPSTSSSLSSLSSSRLRRPTAGFGYGNGYGYRSSLAETPSTSRTLTDDTPSSTFSSSSSSVYASPAPLPEVPMSAAAVTAAPTPLPSTALPSDGDDRIRVACRVKPREPGTSAAKVCTSVGGDERTVTWAGDRADGATARHFTFDYAAGEGVNQEELFQKIGLPVTNACLEGFNGTIFCYGQTGSGKTYTTFGPPDEASWIQGTEEGRRGDGRTPVPPQSGGSRGLVPRVLEYLFDRFSDGVEATTQPGGQGTSGLGPSEVQICRCSFYEIYNEQVYDLTVPEDERVSLNVREATGKGIFLEGLSETEVKTAREACEVLRKGYASRHTASTAMNSSSSRSHAIFTLVIDTAMSLAEPHQPEGDLAEETPGVSTRGRGQGSGKKQAPEDGSVRLRSARFNLVDLAGSERQRRTQAGGAMLKDAASINKSLSALGRVINSLVEGAGSGHVPYRDSKLTRLLAHSLGGNSKTVLVATVSGDVVNAGETLSTLKFVQRAKMIKNRAIRNEATHSSGLALQQENAGLKKLLADQEHFLSQARLKLREADSHRSHLATEVETLREEAKRNKETALEAWEQLSERQSKLEELQKALAEKERQLEEAATASPEGDHRRWSLPGAIGGNGEAGGSTGGASGDGDADILRGFGLSRTQIIRQQARERRRRRERRRSGGDVTSPTPTSPLLLQGGHLVVRRLRFGSNGSGGSGGLSSARRNRQAFLSSPVTFGEREEGSRDGVSGNEGANRVDELGDWKDVNDGDLIEGGGLSDEVEAVPLATLQRVSLSDRRDTPPPPSVGGGDKDSPKGENVFQSEDVDNMIEVESPWMDQQNDGSVSAAAPTAASNSVHGIGASLHKIIPPQAPEGEGSALTVPSALEDLSVGVVTVPSREPAAVPSSRFDEAENKVEEAGEDGAIACGDEPPSNPPQTFLFSPVTVTVDISGRPSPLAFLSSWSSASATPTGHSTLANHGKKAFSEGGSERPCGSDGIPGDEEEEGGARGKPVDDGNSQLQPTTSGREVEVTCQADEALGGDVRDETALVVSREDAEAEAAAATPERSACQAALGNAGASGSATAEATATYVVKARQPASSRAEPCMSLDAPCGPIEIAESECSIPQPLLSAITSSSSFSSGGGCGGSSGNEQPVSSTVPAAAAAAAAAAASRAVNKFAHDARRHPQERSGESTENRSPELSFALGTPNLQAGESKRQRGRRTAAQSRKERALEYDSLKTSERGENEVTPTPQMKSPRSRSPARSRTPVKRPALKGMMGMMGMPITGAGGVETDLCASLIRPGTVKERAAAAEARLRGVGGERSNGSPPSHAPTPSTTPTATARSSVAETSVFASGGRRRSGGLASTKSVNSASASPIEAERSTSLRPPVAPLRPSGILSMVRERIGYGPVLSRADPTAFGDGSPLPRGGGASTSSTASARSSGVHRRRSSTGSALWGVSKVKSAAKGTGMAKGLSHYYCSPTRLSLGGGKGIERELAMVPPSPAGGWTMGFDSVGEGEEGLEDAEQQPREETNVAHQGVTTAGNAGVPQKMETGTLLAGVVDMLRSQSDKRDEMAEPCLRRSLEIHDKLYGPDHPEVAADMSNLAEVLMDKGDFDAAEPLVRRALEIRFRFLGPTHADVACSLHNLSLIHRTKGNLETADLFQAQAKSIWAKAFGNEAQEEAAPEKRSRSLGTSNDDPGVRRVLLPDIVGAMCWHDAGAE